MLIGLRIPFPTRACRDAGSPSTVFGIATRDVVAGDAGADTRSTYTCIGKTVHLAARLGAHTKTMDVDIVVDAHTYDALDEPARTARIEDVRIKGFSGALLDLTTRNHLTGNRPPGHTRVATVHAAHQRKQMARPEVSALQRRSLFTRVHQCTRMTLGIQGM